MPGPFHRMQGLADLPAILYKLKVEKVIICPGSRNAPLINAFLTYGLQDCISIVDERSAAYFAMGLAQQTQQAVAITCTSGTAAVNLYPAITEAYYLGIPFIVITADRPPEWIDKGDGQTIRQHGLFSNHIKFETTLPVETISQTELSNYHAEIGKAVDAALSQKPGPVHLNVPLREPLYEMLPGISDISASINTFSGIKVENLNAAIPPWSKFEKKMIIAGAMPANMQLNEVLNKISKRKDVIVFAENISNIQGENIINNPEVFMASLHEDQLKLFQPDVLITCGDAVVSKRLKQYLRKYKAVLHIQISAHAEFIDTYETKGYVLQAQAATVFSDLDLSDDSPVSYAENALIHQSRMNARMEEFFSESSYTDIYVTRELLKKIPANSVFHLANSTPVRLTQLFTTRDDIVYYSNRGTSGIDGCLSTAAGAASGSDKQHFLICGDLSFIYDSNALWNNQFPKNLKIIVLNNGGGNIFNLIDTGEAFQKINPYLLTPHNVNIEKITTAFGLNYFFAGNNQEFENSIQQLIHLNGSGVLEVKTIMEENALAYRNFFKALIKG